MLRCGIAGVGNFSGACNNVQLGDAEVLVDSGFVTKVGGRYQLGTDSQIIDGGLTCRNDALPDDYVFPESDLNGNMRVGSGEQEGELDLGAFEFQIDSYTVFVNGFEFPPHK